MILAERELTILYWLAHGHNDVDELSEIMGVSPSQTYASVRSMKRKGVLDDGRGIEIAANPFAVRLLHVMGYSDGRAKCLSGHALNILACLREPRTADELIELTRLSRSTVFRYIKTLGGVGAIREASPGYQINDRAWVDLRKLLNSMEDYEEVLDCRVSRGSEIYLSNSERVVYSNDVDVGDQRTAFSAFADYGDESFYDTGYYTTYRGEISLDQAFDDAFVITEVTQDFRLRSSLLSMYIKNRDRLHPRKDFVEIYERLESGERPFNWPNLKEIEAKVEEGL